VGIRLGTGAAKRTRVWENVLHMGLSLAVWVSTNRSEINAPKPSTPAVSGSRCLDLQLQLAHPSLGGTAA
jgi:hypothetical protein